MDQQILDWINTPFIAHDTETTGLDIFKGARPFCYIVSFDKTKYNVTFDGDDYGFDYGNIRTIVTKDKEKIRHLMEDDKIAKVCHNMKFDRLMNRSVGLKMNGPLFCTAIASHLLDENTPNSLDFVSREWLKDIGLSKMGEELEDWFKDNNIKKSERRYDQVPWNIMRKYAAYDSLVTYLVWEKMREVLQKPFRFLSVNLPPLAKLFYQEMLLNEVLCKAYWRGVQVDVPYLEKMKDELELKAMQTEWEIYDLAKQEFNIGSSDQLSEVLIANGAQLELTDKSKVKGAKKLRYKTGEDELKKVNHPIAKKVIDYRFYTKMKSTFIEGLLEAQVDGVVRTNLNQIGTTSGRFSSSNPNLQNNPKPEKLSKYLDSDGNVKEKYAKKNMSVEDCKDQVYRTEMVRKAFISRPGYRTYAIDFKQQEYRVFLEYANELELLHKVNAEDTDYHELIMSEVPELEDRDMAKTYNFAVIYGASGKRIDEMLGTPPGTGERLKTAFFARFEQARTFMSNIDHRVRTVGIFCNKYGRYRRLKTSEAYKAVNSLVQGCCADYTKEKMIQVSQFIEKHGGFLLLSIHDELLFELPIGKEHLIETVCKIMASSNDLSIIKELGLYSYSDQPLFRINLGVDPSYFAPNWAKKADFKMEEFAGGKT